MKERTWKAYSFATGFAADVAALATSSAISDNVQGTPRGIVTAAVVMELPLFVFLEGFSWSASRVDQAETEDVADGYVLLGLGLLALAVVWIVVGLVFADLATSEFDISGFLPYVGTMALVAAATLAIYLPLYVRREMMG